MEVLRVVLDGQGSTYLAGQAVSGKVILELSANIRVNALKLRISGRAKTRFKNPRHRSQIQSRTESNERLLNHENEPEYVTDTETVFEYSHLIIGRGGGEVALGNGYHTFPFSVTLPIMAPSSLEGEHGSIRYKVEATLDRPWRLNHHAEARFEVVTPMAPDLAQAPLRVEEQKHFGFCCCQSAPLIMMLSLPHTGIVPGGSLPFTVDIENGSNVEVTGIRLELLKMVTYRASIPHHAEQTSSTRILKAEFSGSVRHGSKTWTGNLRIPQIPCQNHTTCSIIRVQYVLEVTAVVSGLHLNLDFKVPVILTSARVEEPPPPPPYDVAPPPSYFDVLSAEKEKPQAPPRGFAYSPMPPSAPSYM